MESTKVVKKHTKTRTSNGMTGGSKANGYTVIEVMIFLAVSAVLLVGAFTVIGGQQAKTQFFQSATDVQTQIEDVINDNDSGYFNKSTDFTCQAPLAGGAPSIIDGANNRGTNAGCTYLGKAIQFLPSNPNQYVMYNVVGRQFTATPNSKLVTSYQEAQPIAIYQYGASPVKDGSTLETMAHGLTAVKIKYDKGGAPVPASAIGFLARLDQYSYGSASMSTQIYVINGNLSDSQTTVEGNIKAIGQDPTKYDVDRPVTICFLSGTTNQGATLTIGASNGRLSTDLKYFNGRNCPW